MSEFKTLHFTNTQWGQKEKNATLAREEAGGWRIVSETIVPGKFKGSDACCLFLICAPLALTAGHHPDQITVTLERSSAADMDGGGTKIDRQKWNALLLYDNEIAAAAEQIKPYGQKWSDELASAYLALNDTKYLPAIIEKIITRARAERADNEARAAREEERGLVQAWQGRTGERSDSRADLVDLAFGTSRNRDRIVLYFVLALAAILIVWGLLSIQP